MGVALTVSGILCWSGILFSPYTVHCACVRGASCTCARTVFGVYIKCSDRKLMSVPWILKSNKVSSRGSDIIQEINLSRNSIREIPEAWLANSTVKEVILDLNPIHNVESRSFLGASSLFTLHINKCNLTAVPSLFKYSKQLRAAYFSGNRITHVKLHTFAYARELKILDLSENPLLFTIDMFVGLVKLETLRLAQVGLAYVPRDALTSLRSLRNLILDRNRIKQLNSTSFYGMPQLAGSFYSFERNSLSKIKAGAFRKHPKPFNLKLDSNRLRSLEFLDGPPCLFEGCDISVVDNPLHCDCRLYDKLKYQVFTILGSCASPDIYRNKDLHYVPALDGTMFEGNPFLKPASEVCERSRPRQRFDCRCNVWENVMISSGEPKKCPAVNASRPTRGHSRYFCRLHLFVIFIVLEIVSCDIL